MVMEVSFSCATREAVQSATIRAALAVRSTLVASGSALGISAMTAASGQAFCALSAPTPIAELIPLVKSLN